MRQRPVWAHGDAINGRGPFNQRNIVCSFLSTERRGLNGFSATDWMAWQPVSRCRQMPGRSAYLPGIAMFSGRSGYPRNASIMPGNLFMFHYRFSLPFGGAAGPAVIVRETAKLSPRLHVQVLEAALGFSPRLANQGGLGSTSIDQP